MWVAPKQNVPKFTLDLSCLVDWMIELSISNKEQTRHIGNFTLYSFNTPSGAGGRSISSHNSLSPPPHACHQPRHTLLWDGIPFLNQELLQISHRGCVGHKHVQHAQSDTKSVKL